jgi:hypothetical protein
VHEFAKTLGGGRFGDSASHGLVSRLGAMQPPHHMINRKRNHPDVEARLRQTSLCRADLDLVVHDSRDRVAAYGLLW